MFKPRSIIVLLGMLCTLCSNAQNFEWSDNCRQAYDLLIALRLEEAQEKIRLEQSNNPSNELPLLLDNQREMLIVFLGEQASDLAIFAENKDARLTQLKSSDKTSAYHLFVQAEIKLQSALARLKFEEYLGAAWEIRQAYKLLLQNDEKFPNFAPNKKTLGYIHALIGTVPDSYKWLLKILGFSGEVQQGINEIKQSIQNSKAQNIPVYQEAQLIYAFFLIYLDTKYYQAEQIIENDLQPQTKLLDTFTTAHILFRLGRIEESMQVIQNRPQSSEYYYIYYFDYMLGALKLYQQEADAAQYLRQFVNNFKGRHFIKDAYQKLAWYHLIQGDEAQYKHYISQCLHKGEDLFDTDKKALEEAQNGIVPNVSLLHARLLFDGALYQESLQVLEQMPTEHLNSAEEKIEKVYRLARAYEGLKDWDTAIHYYQASIEESGSLPLYFAPKSALQLGLILERQNDPSQARHYFEKALSYPKHAYKDSIDQQAKAGIERLN